MKNREKFAKEILDIACEGRNIAVTKENKIVYCSEIPCKSCIFDDCGKHIGRSQSCADRLHKWAESEYKEKPTITSKEKKFLDLILAKWEYIARDADEKLYAFDLLPSKKGNSWCIESGLICNYCNISEKLFGKMFDFIKWEDEKPWSIEDLKKLEVKDE